MRRRHTDATVENGPRLNTRGWSLSEYLVLGVVLAVVVLYSIPPWRSYFFTGLGEHWDTQLMGQWMAWNAHNILHGKVFLPDFNTNYFYPHSLTLAFGEMLWPESFIYAALYGSTHNPFFSFNGTMLFFWTMAGICMYAFLRELRINRVVGYLGSFIYCLMPLLLMYYIEFNMVLIFIIPLMSFLFIRWLRNPAPGTALLFCFGIFLSVTSCIYYTYMVIFPLFCMFVAYLANHRSLLYNKTFYWTLALIGVVAVFIAAVFLHPYLLLKMQGGYERNMNDFLISHAQPLAYLDTRSSALFTELFMPETRWQETYLFPGSVLAVLAFLYFITQPFFVPGLRGKRRWLASGIVIVNLTLWLVFWLIIFNCIGHRGVPRITNFAPWLYPLSLALLALYAIRLFLPYECPVETVFITGLAAGAVICFFISLGPYITIGLDTRLIKMAHGPFYALFDKTDIFSAVRGLTRFAIVVMVYLIVGSCVLLHRLLAFEKRLLWFFPLLLFFLVFEARLMKYRYADYKNLVSSPVIQHTQALPEKSVLFQIPTTPKVVNAHSVLNTIGKFPFLVNGYSGFVPDYFSQIMALLYQQWKVAEVTEKLREIWPRVFLLIDRPSTKWLASGWQKPFPWAVLNASWELMDQDADYSLYRLRPKVFTAGRLIRRIRTDVLKANSMLLFTAREAGDSRQATKPSFHILLNGQEVAKGVLKNTWQDYRFALPEGKMGNITGDRVVLELLPAKPSSKRKHEQVHWQVRKVSFAPPAAPKSIHISSK